MTTTTFEEQPPQRKSTDITVHKIWRRGRFANLTYWPQGNKFAIDIGEFDTNTNKLTGSTKCFVNTLPLFTYLHAEVHGELENIFPDFDKSGFSVYGGRDGIARVFKSHWWVDRRGDEQVFDKRARVFKCGHFKAKPGGKNGAIIPDMSQQLSLASIKISSEELAQFYHATEALVKLRPNVLVDVSGVEDIDT